MAASGSRRDGVPIDLVVNRSATGQITSTEFEGRAYSHVDNTSLHWRRIWYALVGFRHNIDENRDYIIKYISDDKYTINSKDETMSVIRRFNLFMDAVRIDMQNATVDTHIMMISLLCVMPQELYRLFEAYRVSHYAQLEWLNNILINGLGKPPIDIGMVYPVLTDIETTCYTTRQEHLNGICAVVVNKSKNQQLGISDHMNDTDFLYFQGINSPIKQPIGMLRNILPRISIYSVPALSQMCFRPGFERILTVINDNAWLKNASLTADETFTVDPLIDSKVDTPTVAAFTFNNPAGVTDGAERVLHGARRVGNAVFYENNLLLGTLGRQEMSAVDAACSTLVVSGCGVYANTMFAPSISVIFPFKRTIVHSSLARIVGFVSRSSSKTA
jgi:hypothetical protein